MVVIYLKKLTTNSKIENKIATDHDHDKYITCQEFNKLTSENFRLKQANLASKNGIANFIKKAYFDNKLKDVTANKNELNELTKKVKTISKKGLIKDFINKFSIFNVANYFSSGLFQNCLLFIPVKKHSKHFNAITKIDSSKFNGISVQSIENIIKSDNNFDTTFVYHHLLFDMTLNWHCLIKNNISISNKVKNLYISLTLGPQLRNLDINFTLGNCLFESKGSYECWSRKI